MFSVQVEGFDEFVRDLRVLGQTEVRSQMVRELKPVAERIASDARGRAGRHVARGIKTGSRSNSPAVIVDGTEVPDAKLWEWGGRHPVYGNMDTWVYQSARPYVGPAVDAHLLDAQVAIGKALDNALLSAGWR